MCFSKEYFQSVQFLGAERERLIVELKRAVFRVGIACNEFQAAMVVMPVVLFVGTMGHPTQATVMLQALDERE